MVEMVALGASHHWPLGQSTTVIEAAIMACDQRRIALRLCGPSSLPNKESTMKLTTIALASAFALSGTFAFAQAGGPNGTAGGPTSLSGTGPSTSGGDS